MPKNQQEHNFEMYSLTGIIGSVVGCTATCWKLWFKWPILLFNFYINTMKAFLSVFTYHLFSMPAQPLHNELALIIGSDSTLGRAFATQITKMNGTVICVDTEKDKGDAFVKELNAQYPDMKAFFFECDVRNKESLAAMIEKITKDIGDVSILLNCSRTDVVATYFDVFKAVLPIMKSNRKGTLVFLRMFDAESRNAVQTLHESFTKKLSDFNSDQVTTLIAHVYPKVGVHGDETGVFGSIAPDTLAMQVLEGVAKKRSDVFIPEYMLYLSFWMKFMPESMTDLLDGFFFDDKNQKKVK